MGPAILNKNYPMKVWITGIIMAPVILILFFISGKDVSWYWGFIGLYAFYLFPSILFALPSIFLYKLAFRELGEIKSEFLLKLCLSLIAFVCLGFSFVLLEMYTDAGYGNDTLIPFLCFYGSICISGLLYRARKKINGPGGRIRRGENDAKGREGLVFNE